MQTAKLFENGRSQAVRLPKDCRFEGQEMYVHKIGNIVLLLPKENSWESFLEGIELFTDDFMEDGRAQEKMDTRESL